MAGPTDSDSCTRSEQTCVAAVSLFRCIVTGILSVRLAIVFASIVYGVVATCVLSDRLVCDSASVVGTSWASATTPLCDVQSACSQDRGSRSGIAPLGYPGSREKFCTLCGSV